MKKIILIAILLTLFNWSCNRSQIKQNEVSIKEISISTYGGRSAIISETYIFKEDSIHYRFFAHDTTRNTTTSYFNTKEDWKGLLKKNDLQNFKNIKNGKSYQETDGSDTTISVVTEKGKEYYITNGDKSKIWNEIYKELNRQINSLKQRTHNNGYK